MLYFFAPRTLFLLLTTREDHYLSDLAFFRISTEVQLFYSLFLFDTAAGIRIVIGQGKDFYSLFLFDTRRG